MRRPTVLLIGGRHKGEPYTALLGEMARIVTRVIAYGESAPLVAADLRGPVPVEQTSAPFDEVLRRARDAARPGDVILLSPACSSYDMFSDYEERGRVFKQLAANLGAAA